MFPQGRRIICTVCPHFRQCGAWDWPKCYCGFPDTADPAGVPDLTTERFEAEEPTCPAGRWQTFDEPGVLWQYPMRKQTCAECEHGRNRNPYDSPLCVQGGAVRLRTGEFMTGPDSNCPAGKWEGLKGLPVALSPEQREALTVQRQVERWTEPLRETIGQNPDRDAILESMVAAGLLHPDAAVQIAEALDAQ